MEIPNQYILRVLHALDHPGTPLEAGVRTAYAILDASENGITPPDLRAVAYASKGAVSHCVQTFQRLEHVRFEERSRTRAYYPTARMERFCTAFNRLHLDIIGDQLSVLDGQTLERQAIAGLAGSYGLPEGTGPSLAVQEVSAVTGRHPLSVVHSALGGYAVTRGVDMGVRETLLEAVKRVPAAGQSLVSSVPAPR